MVVPSLPLIILMGLMLGLLGGGGSILAVPILKCMVGFGAREAIASSLVVVGATSVLGAAAHWRRGDVRLRVALLFGLSATAGAYVGAKYVANILSGAAQLLLLGAVMLVAALFMFRESGAGKDRNGPDGGLALGTALPLLAVGAGVGILTGLVGVGGGFLIVPALTILARMPIKAAVGTSLLVITMNSASAFAGYLGKVDIPWDLVTLFTALAVVGSFAGSRFVRYVPQDALRRLFAAFLVAMATFILYQNSGAISFS